MDNFSPEFLAALGRVTVSYSELEKRSSWLLCTLVSPHWAIGNSLCTGASLTWIIERIAALSMLRIADEPLRQEILAWKTRAVSAAEERNGLIHANWGFEPNDGSGQTIKQNLKKGELRVTVTDRTLSDIQAIDQRLRDAANEAVGFFQDLWASRFVRRDIAGPVGGNMRHYLEDASPLLQPDIVRHHEGFDVELLKRGVIVLGET